MKIDYKSFNGSSTDKSGLDLLVEFLNENKEIKVISINHIGGEWILIYKELI